jgi:L-fuconolactonase
VFYGGAIIATRPSLRVVDSHCHVSRRWFEPVETLLSVMDRCGVEQAVLIQILNERDNSYLLDCVRSHPDRFAGVVGIDAIRSDVRQHLSFLSADGATGVRLRATDRSEGDDPLLVWRVAADLQLAVSCVGSIADFCDPAFAALIETFPRLPIVLEHLASAARGARTGDGDGITEVFKLARFHNVMVKVPGIGEISERSLPVSDTLFQDPVPSVLAEAYAAFGPDHLMWASDFPPVAAREGYENALVHAELAIESMKPGGLSQVFGDTARRVFFR